MNDLVNQVKALEGQLAVCTRCGMCQSVCPLFERTRKESDVARGKLALLNGLTASMFSDPDGVNERLNRCLLCGSCAANCPSSVNILDIFIRARTLLADYKGLSFIKKIIFKRMLANPKTFNTLVQWASHFQNLVIKNNQDEQGTSCARFISPLLKDRRFMPMAGTPFHRSVKQLQTPASGSGPRVLLFTGCLIDKIMPKIAEASVEALTHHQVRLIIPEDQGCCGIPALASGDQSVFNQLVSLHINLFKRQEFDYLVTACATCTSTIKKLWPTLYKPEETGKDQDFLNKLAACTMDINEFLVDVMDVQAKKETALNREPVTYHDPCHLKKSLGIFTQPRQIIKAAGHPLKEMLDSDACCGMGGSFNLLHYDLSGQIGSIKQKNITDTQCTTVASGCPACIMQISDMLSRAESGMRVKHPIELYADSIKTAK